MEGSSVTSYERGERRGELIYGAGVIKSEQRREGVWKERERGSRRHENNTLSGLLKNERGSLLGEENNSGQKRPFPLLEKGV